MQDWYYYIILLRLFLLHSAFDDPFCIRVYLSLCRAFQCIATSQCRFRRDDLPRRPDFRRRRDGRPVCQGRKCRGIIQKQHSKRRRAHRGLDGVPVQRVRQQKALPRPGGAMDRRIGRDISWRRVRCRRHECFYCHDGGPGFGCHSGPSGKRRIRECNPAAGLYALLQVRCLRCRVFALLPLRRWLPPC